MNDHESYNPYEKDDDDTDYTDIDPEIVEVDFNAGNGEG